MAKALVLFVFLAAVGLLAPMQGQAEPIDISSDVSVSYGRSILDRRTNTVSFSATVSNTSGAAIAGPITLQISNIAPNGSTLLGHGAPVSGVYSVVLPGGLAAGGSTQVPLQITLLGRARLSFDLVPTIEVADNAAPVADAGADQTAQIGQGVTLNGTGSSDADGDPLTYAWAISSAPAGSTAALTGANTANPGLTPDVAGAYVVALIVNDGTQDSAAGSVTISTINSAPVANAGPDQSADLGDVVSLSGAASTDIDGDALSYSWALAAAPAGSAVATSGTGAGFGFSPDVNGIYVYVLTVSDGALSDTDQVQIAVATDLPPVADAGPDKSAPVGGAVMLDGTGSSDPDGGSLTYAWSLTSVPAGSTAAFSDATDPMPSVTLDVAGTYVAQLIVNDGTQNSAPDTVVISTLNTAPVANAGADQAVALFATANLTGAGSSDVDGDALTYSWAILSRPAGSGATLSDTAAVQPSLTTDAAGDYVVQLTVSDGTASDTDTVTVSTLNSVPVADAGADQSGPVGAVIALDGTGSSDADGDTLSYAWTLSSRPAGSAAALSNANSATASVQIDYPGTYVVHLVVNDGTVNSPLNAMTITTVNSKPLADAGDDQTVYAGQTVTLDPAGSTDADFDPLTHSWSMLSKPAAAPVVDLVPGLNSTVSFRPLVVGTYVAQLISNDGTVDSDPDTVVIEVEAPIAALSASPLIGAAPLEVQLTAQMVGGFGPYQFVWDNGVTLDSYTRLFSQPGNYTVSVTITDSAGYSATKSETVVVLIAPTVEADATPTGGVAPLTVAFSAVATDADGVVSLYQWDFTDDGVFDTSDAATASTSFTYSTPGLYTARLRVTDDDGLTTDDTLTITVGEPPILDAAATPLVGTAPLEVTFTASASDNDGVIARYEWDFESDGVVDFTSATDGNTTHIYDEGGVFSATARVFDNDGLLAERSFIVSVSGPPVALPRAYPLVGKAPLTVTFFASGTDFDGSPEFYDWDYNGDGFRDIRLIATMNSTYTYTTPGTYQAALTVIDDDVLTDTKTVEITVLPGDDSGSGITANAAAVPNNGGAPLDVTLIGSATTNSGSIASYSWDFNNDGVPDFTEDATAAALLNPRLDVGSYAAPAFMDMNGDGLLDMVVGSSFGGIVYFLNQGTAALPIFTTETDLMITVEVTDPVDPCEGQDLETCDPCFGQEVCEPCIDCVVLGVQEFSAGNSAGMTTVEQKYYPYSYGVPLPYDVNGDGLMDLLVGDYIGNIDILINDGTAAVPVWTLQPQQLTLDGGALLDVGYYASPEAFDLDGDGDLDLLVGNSAGTLQSVIRAGTAAQPIWQAGVVQTDVLAATIDVGSNSAPLMRDMNGDGLLDLVVGTSNGQASLYTNTGSATVPVWTSAGMAQTSTGSTTDIGSYMKPANYDFDGDGTGEIVAGDSSGYISVLDVASPNLMTLRLYYDEIDVGSYAAPALVNLDADADFDVIVGNSDGTLTVLRNIGTDQSMTLRQQQMLFDDTGALIDVGSYAAPAVHDYDADGDPDLLVGNSTGRLFVVRNTGTAAAPIWAAPVELLVNGTGSPIDVGSYAAPHFVDLNADGVLDVLVGDSSGNLEQLVNTGTNAAPVFAGPVLLADRNGLNIDVGSYASPVVFDYDGDGVDEVFVGNSTGYVYFYENRVGSSLSLVLESTDFVGLDVGSYAAPAAADLDADGDVDMLIGNSNGVLYDYYTRGQVKVTYTVPGQYVAAFTATNTFGETETVFVPINVAPAGTPTGYLVSDVVEGNGPLDVVFTYSGADPDGTVASYALDVDSDGTPEATATVPGEFAYTYLTAGVKTATLTVTDNEGKSIDVTTDVVVRPTLTASLATISFNPLTGGTAVVETTFLAADGPMTVDIIDGAGALVRRLVNGVQRGSGTFQDAWDGRNTAGQIMPDGAYYVVISVVVEGETITYDARTETVFEELTPSRNWSSSFNPYLGVPVSVAYTVPWPAEVTLYFWTRDYTRVESSIAPVRTVFLRLPRVPGSYTDYWDGFNDQGVAVAAGQQYPVTLWLYRLPSNAILITGNTPAITAIDINPRYFNPAFNPYGASGAATADLVVTIDKAATLVVDILNAEGVSVRRISAQNRAAGANTVAWDGRDSEGELVAPGTYSLGVVAVDVNGNRSLPRYAATTVRY